MVAFKLIIDDPTALVTKKVILAITTAMLFAGLVPNLRWWAFRLIAVGLILNTIVIGFNGGLMPATPENASIVFGAERAAELQIGESPPGAKNVLLAAEDTKLRVLSDVIRVSWLNDRIMSIGDVFLYIGLIIFVGELLFLTVRPRRWTRKNKTPETVSA